RDRRLRNAYVAKLSSPRNVCDGQHHRSWPYPHGFSRRHWHQYSRCSWWIWNRPEWYVNKPVSRQQHDRHHSKWNCTRRRVCAQQRAADHYCQQDHLRRRLFVSLSDRLVIARADLVSQAQQRCLHHPENKTEARDQNRDAATHMVTSIKCPSSMTPLPIFST